MEIIRQIRKEIRLVGSFMTGRFIGKYYGIMLFITVLSVITNLVFSYSFSVILSGSRNITVEGGLVLLVFAGGKLSCTVCRFLYSQISLQFKMRLKEQYLSRISGSLLSADYLWIVKQRGGDLIGKSCEDVNWCAEAVAVYVPKFFKSTGLIVFNTVFLSLFHPLFGAAFLLPVPVLFFSEWKGREICQRFLRHSTEVMSERNAVFQDIVSHHDLISHSAVQDKMLNRAEEVCERYAKRFGSSMGALVGYMSPAILLNKLPLILIGILGSVFISRGSIAAPVFLSAFLFTYAFNAELAELDDFMANFPTLAVFLERVKGIWDCPKQSYGNRNVFTETDKMIEFQNVSFRHADDPGKRMIFENVSFTAGRGEHVLLIGKNGCGKTTVLKLICGIYEHGEQGRITLCGYPPKDTALALAGSVFVAGAWFLIQFVNSCLLRTVAKFGQEKGHAAVLLLFLFGLYVAARVPTVLGYRLSGLCAERIVGTANRNLLRTWLYRSREGRLLVSSGKVLSLLLNDSGSVMSDFLFMGFTINFVEPLLLGILSMAVFLMWKPVVLVPFFLLGIPSVMLNRFFQQRVKVYSEQERESFDDLTKFFQYLNEQLVCIRESGIYELLFKKSGSVGKHAVGAEKKKENTIRRAQFVSDLLEDISLVSCVFVCVFLAARQQIEMADLAFVFAFAPFIFRFFNCFTNMWNYLTDVHTSVRRLKGLTEAKTGTAEAEEKPETGIKPETEPEMESQTVQAEEILIRQISFAYPGQEPILKDITFSVPFHERHALTGINGAGKSTLMKLLLGDLTPLSGEIVISIEGKEEPCPQDFFTYIPQEPELLNISFYENMVLDCYRFKRIPKREDVEEIAKILGIHERILSFPKQYDAVVVENGKNLSLGEKQKLVLARALLSPAPCILLDEPEHGLDQETVRAFFDCAASSKRTMIMISHAKANLEFFDAVQTIEDGRVKSVKNLSKVNM